MSTRDQSTRTVYTVLQREVAPDTLPEPPPDAPQTDAHTHLGAQTILEHFALQLSPHFAQAPETLRPHPQEALLPWLWRIAPASQQRAALNRRFAPLRAHLERLQRHLTTLLPLLRNLQQHADAPPSARTLAAQRADYALQESSSLQQAIHTLQQAIPDPRDLLLQLPQRSSDQLLPESQRALLAQLARFSLHELSSPIAATLTNLYEGHRLLTQGPLTTPPWADLVEIYQDAQEGVSRAREILQHFARWGQPPTQQRHALLRVEELVHLALRLYQHDADLRLELEPNLTLRGDRGQLLQILLNLLNNAHEALRDHNLAAPITLRARRTARALSLEVINPLVPLSDDLQRTLFDPFVTTSPDRSGLGLSISRELAQLHGGTLDLYTDAREITFCLRLPALE